MRAPLIIAADLDRKGSPLASEAADCIRRLVAENARKPRSSPHHRRLFAIINAAWKNWPESHEVQCGSPEGLRDYLQIKAGFGTPHKIVRGDTTYIWFEHKSIAYDKMSQEEFKQLADKIEALIEKIVGVPADTLLEQDRMSA